MSHCKAHWSLEMLTRALWVSNFVSTKVPGKTFKALKKMEFLEEFHNFYEGFLKIFKLVKIKARIKVFFRFSLICSKVF